MLFELSGVGKLIEEPGYFNAKDYRRIIEVATGKLSELAAVASQRRGQGTKKGSGAALLSGFGFSSE
ncbi:hypothetical protein A8L45_17020 [Veronia pacifica]|uniref:Uncharacterized protein n=2 Tax=Veronia pacifica TaxID=1080227 RepID=A0A1C3EE18_9GAMM|nr:hypothetical protein A8L45_17020 [Veronia pacifica]